MGLQALLERSFEPFERRIRMPKDADTDKIEAKMENGVLRVTIAKRKDVTPSQVSGTVIPIR